MIKKILIILTLFSGFIFQNYSIGYGAQELLGAGATFPYPLYSKMFDIYHKTTGVKVNYQAIGSGGGIRQIRNKTVDFGASDAFLDEKSMNKFSAPVVHIPMCAGAVVVTYNLPGSPAIQLTPEVLSNILLGKITKWNDVRIKELNSAVDLPNVNIIVVHRSDGSGTTFIFSDYLSKVNSEWKEKVGKGKALNWPVGLGAKGNPGVAGLVKQIPGAIGYVELVYTIQNNMPVATIMNKSGNFVKPTIRSVSLAADTVLPDDMRISLTNSGAESGYPISGFTWIISYKDLTNAKINEDKAGALVKLLWWMIHDGQRYAEPLHYAPLSSEAKLKAEVIIKSITYQGKSLQ